MKTEKNLHLFFGIFFLTLALIFIYRVDNTKIVTIEVIINIIYSILNFYFYFKGE
jgi:hypothetical protein